jgi:Cdc6-like AAA superfamily ATPase
MPRSLTTQLSLESLRFSISDTTGLLPREMTPNHRWLVKHPEAWRLSRSELIAHDSRMTSGVLLLTGEAGCGKTTLMAEEADNFRESSQNFVLHINFMDATRIEEDTRSEDLMPRLGSFLSAQIEANIAQHDHTFSRGLWDDYQAARAREILVNEQGGFLNVAKGKFLARINQLSTAEVLSDSTISQAVRDFAEQRQELLTGLRAIQRVECVDRVVILLDNLDNIGGSHASRCLDVILRTRKPKTLFYCALRNENEYAAAKITTHFSERINVPAPPLAKVIDSTIWKRDDRDRTALKPYVAKRFVR